MFWKTLDPGRISLLKKITAHMPLKDSYLAGGTALALQIGHRKSYDFDWFTKTEFDSEILKQNIAVLGDLNNVLLSKGTFHGTLNNIRVTWLYYPNPLIDNLQETDEIPGLKIASLPDIAIMKLIAISSRGAKRDFVDLYYLCFNGISLREILEKIPEKFPRAGINRYHLIKSLTFFGDAEEDLLEMNNISWDEIKQYFRKIQLELIKEFNPL